MSGLVCSGNFRFAYVDEDGVPTGGYIGIINTTKLELTVPEADLKSRVSKQNETFGQALDTIATPKPMEVTVGTDELGDAETLAWAVGGVPAAFTQAAGSVTDEAVVAEKGRWIRLGGRSLSAVTVTDTTGTTTFAAGTDYLLDATAGFIKPTEAGAITDAAQLKVSYTKAAISGKSVGVGSRPSIQLRIEGDAINLATGKRIHVVVPKAKLAPSGGLDLLGEDFLSTELTGNALVITGQQPATITLLD